MTNHLHKAPSTFHAFLAAASGNPDSGPEASDDDEPRRPLLQRRWFIVALLLTVLIIGVCIYLFFTWGLPFLQEIINRLEEAGVRLI